LGGTWGVLLARVLFELWPLWFHQVNLLALALALCGAVGALLALNGIGHASGGGSMAARSWPLLLGIVYLLQPSVAPLWGIAALIAGVGGVMWLAHADGASGVEWLWDASLLAIALALYVTTLAPSVLPGDSGEFQFAVPTLGIPHPTGYPLYLVLGKLLSLVPVGSIAYRLNLLSAIAASGAV
jgi:hypothetical protein